MSCASRPVTCAAAFASRQHVSPYSGRRAPPVSRTRSVSGPFAQRFAVSRSPARVVALRTVFRTVGGVAPELAARWAETLFCTPPRHEPRSGDEAFLATGRCSTVPWEGEDLALWEWGPEQRPPIVLVHGWGSRAGRFSVMGRRLLEAGYRVVAYDAPAHGRSSGRLASLVEFARALRAVGNRFGPVQSLVGHSLGGAAIVLALRDGLAAERVVLL